ncbi:MAG TPA: preprotein translocase subunit SecY [Thermotogota bacterium]|nr:preprotein translocase subunit SecY [Thermotogota bacterium]HRW91356.1 preprotein translocase subunit SecY [Thermotogota bacterium]
MWKAFRNAFRIPELRDRIFFTLLMLIVYRLGVYIPIPGINLTQWASVFSEFQQGAAGGLFSFYDVFAGGALQRFSILMMSVTPYINASIILSLLQSVVPALKEIAREGEEGKKKMAKITRYLTVGLAVVQGFVLSISIARNPALIVEGISPFFFVFVSTLTIVAGTMFAIWLGERITEKGIGNGISVLIFAGIVSRYPSYVGQAIVGQLGIVEWVILVGTMAAVIVAIIYVQQGERRIAVQYARRVSGRRVYGGQTTYVPIKVNQSGVIPIIFGQAIMIIPTAIASLSKSPGVERWLGNGGYLYLPLYSLLVFFFAYFYSVISFDVHDISENIKKYGGFIPGIRPGAPTERYFMRVLNKMTFMGAVFLVVIAIVPYIMSFALGVSIWIGGTSALIAVGVALDILQQMEAHMIMRNYEGFIKKGRLKGRR